MGIEPSWRGILIALEVVARVSEDVVEDCGLNKLVVPERARFVLPDDPSPVETAEEVTDTALSSPSNPDAKSLSPVDPSTEVTSVLSLEGVDERDALLSELTGEYDPNAAEFLADEPARMCDWPNGEGRGEEIAVGRGDESEGAPDELARTRGGRTDLAGSGIARLAAGLVVGFPPSPSLSIQTFCETDESGVWAWARAERGKLGNEGLGPSALLGMVLVQ